MNTYTDQFLEVWKVYKELRVEAKWDAQLEYNKAIKKIAPDELKRRVTLYVAQRKKLISEAKMTSEVFFIKSSTPHFRKWLYGRRWEEESLLPALHCSGGKVLQKAGSPSWEKWKAHRGWSPAGDWYAESEWPPERRDP